MSQLQPDLVVNNLREIELIKMWESGKRGIILDLDNTITPWHKNELTTEAVQLIDQARTLGYQLYLLSNATFRRTELVARELGVSFTAPGLKPLTRGYRKAMQELKLTPEQVIVIGDQIFTDIWGGNRAGCYTILVTPLENREFIVTRLMRRLERLIGRQPQQRTD